MSDEEWQEVMAQEPAEYREHPNQYQNYWYEGGWSFEIPVTIDTAQTEVLELFKESAHQRELSCHDRIGDADDKADGQCRCHGAAASGCDFHKTAGCVRQRFLILYLLIGFLYFVSDNCGDFDVLPKLFLNEFFSVI